MLTYLTRNKLVNFFLVLNEGERQIEIIRQILNEQEEFEPYAAFKRIDRLDNGVITASDVMKFLADNKVHHTERNCHLFIQRYDNDGDGALGYKEFLQSVLTMENAVLRAITTQRPNYEVAPDQYLTDDIEYALTKVIDREINFYIDLDDHKKELLESTDFSFAAAFACIDKYSGGIIDYDNLKAFFKNQAIYPGDEEIIAILRRIDRDDDGLINFSEFTETLEPVSQILKATANRRNASSRFESPKKAERDSQIFNSSTKREASPLRRTASPTRKIASPPVQDHSPFIQQQDRSPLMNSRSSLVQQREDRSPLANNSRSSLVQQQEDRSPLANNSRSSLVQQQQERSPFTNNTRSEASPSKITSANKVTRSFASPSNSFITSERNLAQSLAESRASPVRRQASPVRRQASPLRREASSSPQKRIEQALSQSMASGKVSPLRKIVSPGSTRLNESFGNQSALLSPSGDEGGSGLKKNLLYKEFPTSQPRSPVKFARDDSAYVQNVLNSSTKSRFDATSPEKRSPNKSRLSSATKSVKKGLQFDENVSHYILIQTLKQFIILDKDVEVAKQDLTLKSDFNLLDFFRTFDTANCGSVSVKDLEAGLIRYGIYPNREELSLFFRKIDLDNDGLLRFSDFADAFTPKQKEYSNLLHNRTPSNIDCIVDLNRVLFLS